MTLLQDRPVTSQGPTAGTVWRRNRGALALALLLIGTLTLLAVVAGTGKTGALDPDAYDPAGAHALAQLLRDQGASVVRTTDLPSTQAATTPTSTTFVPLPQLLSDEELALLLELPGGVVIAGAGTRTLDALGVDATVVDRGPNDTLSPRCPLPAASNAGRAQVGGIAYAPGPSAVGAIGCYPVSGHPTLLSLPGKRLVLLGNGEGLTNGRLDKDGNAALGLGLLGSTDKVVWLVPAPDRTGLGDKPLGSPNDLLPGWVGSGVLQLVLAGVVLALWRARRLGRVVPEPLPVVVRASETVEGRGRLYRVTQARDTAAEALRSAARDQLSRRLHGGAAPSREVLVLLVAERSTRSAAETEALLYGRAPSDDAALVGLADALDTLIREVADS